jgi:predicted nucleic acid-binding protein
LKLINAGEALMKLLRIYLDTSVFGGCFDPEFARESNQLMEEVRAGRFRVLVSDLVVTELGAAPERVRQVLLKLPSVGVGAVTVSTESERLRDAYIEAGVVGPASAEDAEHIAVATVADADMVVSWNFKHIVHYDKIAGYNAVNLLNGYKTLSIYPPREVMTP